MSSTDLAEFAQRHVVTIEAGSSFGSGFFMNSNTVVTCFHVVKGSERIKLKSPVWEGEATSVSAWDEAADVAILRVQPVAAGLGLKLSSRPLPVGSRLMAVTSPLGLENTFSEGVLSAIRAKPRVLLQFTAPVSPGSSGGPVLNSSGEVVGIVANLLTVLENGRTYGQNLNFAVPSVTIQRIALHPKDTSLNQFANATVPDEEKRWRVVEAAFPSIERALPEELGTRVGGAFVVAIRNAIEQRNTDEMKRLLGRRSLLKEERKRVIEIAGALAETDSEGKALANDLIETWKAFVVDPNDVTKATMANALTKGDQHLKEHLRRLSTAAFPDGFAGFPFRARAPAIFSYCYPGYTAQEVPGIANMECPSVPIMPPFGKRPASLTFLNGSLVVVELKATSYLHAVESISAKYGQGRFSVLARERWESSDQKPSFGPNTSYNWQLDGGRIRVGRIGGQPFILFIHADRDRAVESSF